MVNQSGRNQPGKTIAHQRVSTNGKENPNGKTLTNRLTVDPTVPNFSGRKRVSKAKKPSGTRDKSDYKEIFKQRAKI